MQFVSSEYPAGVTAARGIDRWVIPEVGHWDRVSEGSVSSEGPCVLHQGPGCIGIGLSVGKQIHGIVSKAWIVTSRSLPIWSIPLELHVLHYFPILPVLRSDPPAHAWMYYKLYSGVFYLLCAPSGQHLLLSYIPFLFNTPVNGTAFLPVRPPSWKGWCKRGRMLGFC